MSSIENWTATAQMTIVVMSRDTDTRGVTAALYPRTAQVVATVNIPSTQRTATIIAVTDAPDQITATTNYQTGRLQSFGSYGVYVYDTMAAALDGLQDNAIPSRFNR